MDIYFDLPIESYIQASETPQLSGTTNPVEAYLFNMNELKNKLKLHREVVALTDKQIRDTRASYIEQNKPFPVGTSVQLTRQNNTKVVGEIKKYSLYEESTIYISEIRVGNKVISIDKPALEVVKLEPKV